MASKEPGLGVLVAGKDDLRPFAGTPLRRYPQEREVLKHAQGPMSVMEFRAPTSEWGVSTSPASAQHTPGRPEKREAPDPFGATVPEAPRTRRRR